MLESMEQLIQELNLLPRGCTVLCAVSGGADSICLLHALYQLRPKYGFGLAAAHYNHMLRGPESDRDAAFVAQFVQLCCGPQRGTDGVLYPAVPLLSGWGNVSAEAHRRGTGIEETARDLRYAFLRQAAQEAGADRIATAHNAEDNGETILFHLARGSGLRGLTGIRPVGNGLIRPLLTTSRREIEAYLHQYSLPYMYDFSNGDDRYARNRIRHQVVPVLEELYPGLPARLTQTASLLWEDETLLEKQAQVLADQAVPCQKGLSISASLLAQAPTPLSTRALRQLTARLGGGQTCGRVHLESLLRLCRRTDPSAQLDLPNGLTARREYQQLILTRAAPPLPLEEVEFSLPGVLITAEWHLTCTQEIYTQQPQTPWDFWLDQKSIPSLTIRSRHTGDRLKLPGRPTKTVKKWCVEEKLPAHLRPALPVLVCQDRVTAVAGLGPEQTLLPHPGGLAWHITVQPAPNYIGKEEN